MTRRLKSALESRLGRRAPPESVATAWAAQHTATLINLYGVGEGGKLSLQRARGQGRSPKVAEFGEMVLFQPMAKHSAMDKLDARWHFGANEVVLEGPAAGRS